MKTPLNNRRRADLSMSRRIFRWNGWWLAFWLLLAGCATNSTQRIVGPWDLDALSRTPVVAWGVTNGAVQELYYEGEPWNGKPTRVFAYLGRPLGNSTSRHPAMVLVHGGGGKAFKAWAEHWAQRGYVALAMDLSGNGPNGRLPDGGPDQSDSSKFREFTRSDTKQMWTYQTVAAVIRAHSLLRSLPEVDANRTGITGISWGGYLTCIVAGIDSRFKVAVPVYGCGFLGDNSYWSDKSLAALKPETRALWLQLFDPSQYLKGVGCPILFVNGTSDFAYPLDSYQKSYRLVPSKWRQVSVAIYRKHGHIWTFPEVDEFVDGVLNGKPGLVRLGSPVHSGNQLSAGIDGSVITELKEPVLCYTTDSGPWQQRKWKTAPATIAGGRLSAELPSARPIVAFLGVTDAQGAYLSSEHLELPGH